MTALNGKIFQGTISRTGTKNVNFKAGDDFEICLEPDPKNQIRTATLLKPMSGIRDFIIGLASDECPCPGLALQLSLAPGGQKADPGSRHS